MTTRQTHPCGVYYTLCLTFILTYRQFLNCRKYYELHLFWRDNKRVFANTRFRNCMVSLSRTAHFISSRWRTHISPSSIIWRSRFTTTSAKSHKYISIFYIFTTAVPSAISILLLLTLLISINGVLNGAKLIIYDKLFIIQNLKKPMHAHDEPPL